MTQKKLRRIVQLHYRIEHDQEALDQLREKSLSPSTSKIRDVFVQESHTENRAALYIEQATDLRAEIELYQSELDSLTEALVAHSAGLDYTLKQVIKYRYIEFYAWPLIAELLGYSKRHLSTLEEKWRDQLPVE